MGGGAEGRASIHLYMLSCSLCSESCLFRKSCIVALRDTTVYVEAVVTYRGVARNSEVP